MKTKHKLFMSSISFVFICQLVFITCGFGGDKSIPLSSITALKELSTDNKYYTINDKVSIETPYYRFLVKSPHGEYDVLSTKDLFKVCNEIHIIEEFRATEHGSQAWSAAGESLKNIGRGAKQIVKEPKESAKAFARAGGKLVRSIGRLFKKKEGDGKAGDGTDRDSAGEGFFTGKHARQFAYEMGLDVYTDNPYAQALIKEVAKSRSKGSVGTSVGMFFLAPVQGLGLLGNSLTPNGLNAEIELLICNNAPDELRYILNERYKKDLEVASEEGSPVRVLLDNPNYSPREQAYLYYYIRNMVKPDGGNGATGLEGVLDLLGKVKLPNSATFATNQMELYSTYQQCERNLTELVTVSDKLGAVTAKEEMLIIIPYDIADDTSDMQKLIEEIVASAKAHKTKKIQLWLTGEAKSGFASKAKENGITVKENILKLPYFAHKETSQ